MALAVPQTPKAKDHTKGVTLFDTPYRLNLSGDGDISPVPELGFDDTPRSNASEPLTPTVIRSVSRLSNSGSPTKSQTCIARIEDAPIPTIAPTDHVATSLKNEGGVAHGHGHGELVRNLSNFINSEYGHQIKNLTATKFSSTALGFKTIDYNFSQQTKLLPQSNATIATFFRMCEHSDTRKNVEIESKDVDVSTKKACDETTASTGVAPNFGLCTTEIVSTSKEVVLASRHALFNRKSEASSLGPDPIESQLKMKSNAQKDDISRNLAKILPYDVLQRLKVLPMICVSDTVGNSHRRCRHKTKWTQNDTEKLLETMSASDGPWDLDSVTPLIFTVLDKATCRSGRHHGLAEAQFQKLLHFLAQQGEWVDELIVKSVEPFDESDFHAIPAWIAAVTCTVVNNMHAGLKDESATVEQSFTTMQRDLSSNTDRNGSSGNVCHTLHKHEAHVKIEVEERRKSTFTSSVRVSETVKAQISRSDANGGMDLVAALHRGFVPYTWNKKNLRMPINIAIGEAVSKTLGKREHNSGYIYIYWVKGDFGIVKIGVTTRTIDQRLKEWKRQCGHDIEAHPLVGANLSGGPGSDPIPHVYRVERLVHTELRLRRLQEIKCQKCSKQHREWFYVNAEHAKQVVLKWSKWMVENKPYESPSLLSSSLRLEEMCMPLQDNSSKSTTTASHRHRRPSFQPARRRTENFPSPQQPVRRSARLNQKDSFLTVDAAARV